MKEKILFGLLILMGCTVKPEKGGSLQYASSSASPCRKEGYYSIDTSLWNPLPVFQKQFGISEIPDGCIRIYYLPSFEKEMVLDLCKTKAFVRMPDTGTVWGSMQIVKRDDKGTISSGRVAKISDSIPKINIKTEIVEENTARTMYHQLDSIGVWDMMSIKYEDCMMMDGIGVEVQSKRGMETNWLRYSVANYKDTRYRFISDASASLYKKHL